MTEPLALRASGLAALPGVRHAFFTRKGGVSSGLYESLNVGRGSGDDPEAVAENRRRVAAWFEIEPGAMLTAYQTHSATAHVARLAWSQAPEGDAVVTGAAGLACGAMSADCAPVLIADAEARVVASVHAGWRGALDGVIGSAIEAMKGLGARAERMTAAIGPCISQSSYEVGLDFLDRFLAADPAHEAFFQPGVRADKRLFDLPGFALKRLADAGVAEAEWIGRDTCAEADLFFSNRRAVLRGEPDYGRLLSAIMLTP